MFGVTCMGIQLLRLATRDQGRTQLASALPLSYSRTSRLKGLEPSTTRLSFEVTVFLRTGWRCVVPNIHMPADGVNITSEVVFHQRDAAQTG